MVIAYYLSKTKFWYMEINGLDSLNTQVRFSELSHNQKIDLRINQLFAKEDRNSRRELLQANLHLKLH